MAAHKRSEAQRAADRAEIARRYLCGESQAAIADALTQRNLLRARARLQTEADLIARELQRTAGKTIRPQVRDLTPDEIAEATLTQQQISYDLGVLRKAWVAEAQIDFSERVAFEIAKIDQLERTYWSAWERSKQDKTVTSVDKTDAKTASVKASKKTEARDGNPVWLEGVQRCIELRCKLLGLNAASLLSVQVGPQKDPLTGQTQPHEVLFRWMAEDEAQEQMRAAQEQQAAERAALL